MYQGTTLSLSSTLPMSKQQRTLAGMVLFFFFFCLFKHLHCILQSPKVSYTVVFFSVFPQSERIFMPFLVQLKTLLSPLFGVRSNYKSASSQLAKKLETPLTLIN